MSLADNKDNEEPPLPFAEAAQSHDIVALRQLIASGLDVNAEDWTGQCALYWAVNECWIEGANLLLKSGANPNGSFGMSPFVLASLFDRIDIMKLLLEHGADPKKQDRENGENAIFGAACRGNVEMFDWLLSLGVDPNAREYDEGRTAYMCAIDNDHQEIIKRFEQLGIEYPYER